MKLYECFADKGYHTCVATTFGIDFDAYESVMLPRLQSAGCRNNLVIADACMLTHALNGASELPRRAGTHYSVSGASAAGVFHPKIFLQFGRQRGRLILGSANITPSGLAGNLELVDAINCDQVECGEQQIIAQAWAFVSRFMDADRLSLVKQRNWMLGRVPWLNLKNAATGAVSLADGTFAALLTSGEAEGIAERFAAMIEEPVSRLIVISPFWDPDLTALKFLAKRLGALETAILVDPNARKFPADAIGVIPNPRLFRWGDFRSGRYVHAKAIIAQTGSADHLLVGSTNCTRAALGDAEFPGINVEVSMYRRLPPGGVFDALELATVLTEENIVEPAAIEPPDYKDNLPLEELQRQGAGQFESRGDILHWHPRAHENSTNCSITLYDDNACEVACTLNAIAVHNDDVPRFEMIGIDRSPAFARVHFPDGRMSALAIVTRFDKLASEIREIRQSATQRKIDDLEGEANATLTLLELFDELERYERNQTAPRGAIALAEGNKRCGAVSDTPLVRTLSYEEFLEGRRPRTLDSGATYNSLAGSDVAIVRSIVNRLLKLGDNQEGRGGQDEQTWHHSDFDLGDETDDPENVFSADQIIESQLGTIEVKPADDYERHQRAKARNATRAQLVRAVGQLHSRLRHRQIRDGVLTNYDLVHLRVLLVILGTAASPKPLKDLTDDGKLDSIQVLPVYGGQQTWPVLMGRVLFAMFGGSEPPVKQLHLTNEHDQVPGDFCECWGTCYWCIQACLHAPVPVEESKRIRRILNPIIRKTMLLTLPSEAELKSDLIMSVLDRMSDRFAKDLHLDPAAIREGHSDTVLEILGGRPS